MSTASRAGWRPGWASGAAAPSRPQCRPKWPGTAGGRARGSWRPCSTPSSAGPGGFATVHPPARCGRGGSMSSARLGRPNPLLFLYFVLAGGTWVSSGAGAGFLGRFALPDVVALLLATPLFILAPSRVRVSPVARPSEPPVVPGRRARGGDLGQCGGGGGVPGPLRPAGHRAAAAGDPALHPGALPGPVFPRGGRRGLPVRGLRRGDRVQLAEPAV